MRKIYFCLILFALFLLVRDTNAQIAQPPDDEALIVMAIRGIEQGMRQHRVELITRFLNDTVQDSTTEEMNIGQAAQRFRDFMNASDVRTHDPNWHSRLPRPGLPANWDFEIEIDSVTVHNNTAKAKLKYFWALEKIKAGNGHAGKAIRDVLLLEKRKNVWVLKKSNRLFRFLNTYDKRNKSKKTKVKI